MYISHSFNSQTILLPSSYGNGKSILEPQIYCCRYFRSSSSFLTTGTENQLLWIVFLWFLSHPKISTISSSQTPVRRPDAKYVYNIFPICFRSTSPNFRVSIGC